jgi:hypothetical protein
VSREPTRDETVRVALVLIAVAIAALWLVLMYFLS